MAAEGGSRALGLEDDMDFDSSIPLDAAPSSSYSPPQRQLTAVFNNFDADAFDWTAFEGTYKGRALITRLLHVSTLVQLPPRADSPAIPPSLLTLVIQALRRMIAAVKKMTWDTQLYLRSCAMLDTALHVLGKKDGMEVEKIGEEGGVPDLKWVEDNIEHERRETSRLDVELRSYMSNLIKESIRLTYLSFAELGVKAGQPQSAMKNYSVMREYSSTPQHHLEIGLGIIETCLAYNQPMNLPGHLSKLDAAIERLYPGGDARSARPVEQESMTAGQVQEQRIAQARNAAARQTLSMKASVGRGIVALANKDYEKAARELGSVCDAGGLADWEGKVISTSDIALTTALCVLATGDRGRVKRVLLDRTSFRTSLDDSQQWILNLTRAMVESRYNEAFALLIAAEPLMVLKPFLYPHSSRLIELIQTRSIVQYVEPFATVKIATMATAFGMDENQMLRILEDLIENRKISGKIDLIDRVVALEADDVRANTYNRAFATGKEITNSTVAALFRMKLHEAGIVVDPRPKNARNAPLTQLGPSDSLEFEDVQTRDLAGTLRVPA